jgi:predicted nucleic acid-binding protein
VGILIDTSVFIGAERGRFDARALVEEFRPQASFLSVITASELLHGVHRAKDAGVRAERAAIVERILATIPVLPIDLHVARIHAQVGAEMKSQGNTIGAHDLWLAATCIAYGHLLLTGNLREFSRVPGLDLKLWPAK